MGDDGGVPKSVKSSEQFRDRLVARFYAAAQRQTLKSFPPLEFNEENFTPQSCNDATLVALAQLAVCRIGACRALISLIDSHHQYILAEATPSTPVRPGLYTENDRSLWLGTVAFPRENGVCELVFENVQRPDLSAAEFAEIGTTVLINLQDHPRFQSLPQLSITSSLGFYAGVPIMLDDGTKVGVFGILDDKPRDGLSSEHKMLLTDLAKTTMEHLETLRLSFEHERRHDLVNGLESFIDGLADLKPVVDESLSISFNDPTQNQPSPEKSDIESGRPSLDFNRPDGISGDILGKDHHQKSQPLWELALPRGTKKMFSRAANIVRKAGAYDGVVFFYMSSAIGSKKSSHQRGSVGSKVQHNKEASILRSASPMPQSSTDDSEDCDVSNNTTTVPRASKHRSAANMISCPILGMSDNSKSGSSQEIEDSISRFTARDLSRLIGKNARGRTLVLNQDNTLLSGGYSSSGSGTAGPTQNSGVDHISSGLHGAGHSKTQRYVIRRAHVRSLRKLSKTAQSFACLPLWDFERQRWFAYAVCWAESPHMDPGSNGDLHLLRIFGHVVMQALSQIDASVTEKAKTSFVASISHELRSPLHGILAATTFLQQSSLSRFQAEMVSSISNSGRTLLDTIDHVMDFAKINSLLMQQRGIDMENPTSPTLDDPDRTLWSKPPVVDLALLLEQVLDIVFLGFSVQRDFIYADDLGSSYQLERTNFESSLTSLSDRSGTRLQRGRLMIALVVPHRQNWCIHAHAGSWKRLIMNIFGNALKYTTDGLIVVTLQPDDDECPSGNVILTVTDTGKGMSRGFVEDSLYKPFSQENSFADGTGLGLSVVAQIVKSMKGTIDISSAQGIGTTVKMNLPTRGAEETAVLSMGDLDPVTGTSSVFQALRVCIFQEHAPSLERESGTSPIETRVSAMLSDLIKDWFGIAAEIGGSNWSGVADVVFCPYASLTQVQSIFESSDQKTNPLVVLVTYDALEMAAIQADVRLNNETSEVETNVQPIGPRKLAKIFWKALERKDLHSTVSNDKQAMSPSLAEIPQLRSLVAHPNTSLMHASSLTMPVRYRDVEMSRTPTVLLVDDNDLNRRLLSALMKKMSLSYCEATNGREAVEKYKHFKDTVKVILMDISMPVMDGITATRLIRQFEVASKLPRSRVVALTGLTSMTAKSEAEEAGMDTFLTKPVSFGQLRDFLLDNSPQTDVTSP